MLAQMTPDSPGDPLDEALASSGSAAAAEHVEFDAEQARTWVLAVSSGDGASLVQEDASGVFGNRIALLDFDPEDLDRLRRLVPSVRLVAHPAVESAIAISGSSAQGQGAAVPRRRRLLRTRAHPRRHGGATRR